MDDLRTIRLQLGMTQIALADALGLSQSTISKLESGALTVDVRTNLALEALLARYDASVLAACAPSSGKPVEISHEAAR